MLRSCRTRLRIAYVTDVEGDFSYFARYAERSKVVSWNQGVLSFRDATSHFVYGGDAFDRGDDISFAEALLAFHDAYPSRVHLMLGNRDINKMVFGSPMMKVLGNGPFPPRAAQAFLFPDVMAKMSDRVNPLPYEQFLHQTSGSPVTGKTTLVQWALTHKMGGARTFEHRREELRRLRGQTLSDDEVAQSFLNSALPGGVYYEYLRRGRIALILDGVLFVHGAVVNENVGVLPNEESSLECVSTPTHNVMIQQGTADEWVDALNRFKNRQFEQWSAGGEGAALRRYAFPFPCVPYSVVVHSLTSSGSPRYLGLGGVEFLNRSGIHAVCGGHQPTGDTPCIVQQPGLLSISADNSYCSGGGTRGSSVVEVLFEDDGVVAISGLREDGTPYDFTATGSVVGRHLGAGWWVKVKSGDDRYEAQRTRDSYRTKEVLVLTSDEVEAHLRQSSDPPVDGDAPERWTKEELFPTSTAIKTRRTRSGRCV